MKEKEVEKLLRVRKIKHWMKDFNKVLRIYHSSFPKEERIPMWLLRVMSHWKRIYFLAFYEEDILCGFSYFAVNKDTIFVLFLAVDSKICSQGYGTQILSWIKEHYTGRKIFLDVEKLDENAANSEQREKRVAFYKRNGIFQTGCFFEYDDVSYEILCTDKNFNKEDYNANLKSYFSFF